MAVSRSSTINTARNCCTVTGAQHNPHRSWIISAIPEGHTCPSTLDLIFSIGVEHQKSYRVSKCTPAFANFGVSRKVYENV